MAQYYGDITESGQTLYCMICGAKLIEVAASTYLSGSFDSETGKRLVKYVCPTGKCGHIGVEHNHPKRGGGFFGLGRGPRTKCGEKYLITTDAWFYAPNGETYRAVFGTVLGIFNDKDTLGVNTNRGSTNWYLIIGNMIVAGCQIKYCIKTDGVSNEPPLREVENAGELHFIKSSKTHIYFADTKGV